MKHKAQKKCKKIANYKHTFSQITRYGRYETNYEEYWKWERRKK